MTRNALGKGLSALIREPEPPAHNVAAAVAPAPASPAPGRPDGLQQVDIDLIEPSPYQPRTRFREEALEELARSIRASGIIQPLLVRQRGTRYQLIAGERRWRAAQRAGLQRVPVEQATAFERLINEFHLTQEQVAERTGKDRATIANALRLLRLEPPIRALLEEGRVSAGHGRALLAIQEPSRRLLLAKRAARGGLTVRQIERLASRVPRASFISPQPPIDPNAQAAIESLQAALGTKVHIRPKAPGRPGQIVIEFYDEDQLASLYDRLIGHVL
jgi:ParB family transcriptional regulator, chromosome partitioning protein